ncbi:hypothetical protein PIB30_005343 [Stylosanthes scabra]|uniref:Uncharacterized protein n=1 Tax=Stylosanthes scabra TaxID=79078 RepID=A0ABU6V2Y7_9FABA|nr:hypothetical protein [Stylosanthes scabra]
MADLPGYLRSCLNMGKLAFLAILVSGGIVLQVLACALYNNWWPMLSAITYVLLPMPLLFFAGSNGSSVFSESDSSWVNLAKFLTGFSTIGSIAIPSILRHAGVIGWGAFAMELSSFFVFVLAILCFVGMSDEDDYYNLSKLFKMQLWFGPGARSIDSNYLIEQEEVRFFGNGAFCGLDTLRISVPVFRISVFSVPPTWRDWKTEDWD